MRVRTKLSKQRHGGGCVPYAWCGVRSLIYGLRVNEGVGADSPSGRRRVDSQDGCDADTPSVHEEVELVGCLPRLGATYQRVVEELMVRRERSAE